MPNDSVDGAGGVLGVGERDGNGVVNCAEVSTVPDGLHALTPIAAIATQRAKPPGRRRLSVRTPVKAEQVGRIDFDRSYRVARIHDDDRTANPTVGGDFTDPQEPRFA